MHDVNHGLLSTHKTNLVWEQKFKKHDHSTFPQDIIPPSTNTIKKLQSQGIDVSNFIVAKENRRRRKL